MKPWEYRIVPALSQVRPYSGRIVVLVPDQRPREAQRSSWVYPGPRGDRCLFSLLSPPW